MIGTAGKVVHNRPQVLLAAWGPSDFHLFGSL